LSAGNIVILTQYFLPETGAPQSRLYETALGLKERGWNVAIVTAMPNYPSGAIFPAYRHRFYCKDAVGGLDVHRYTLYPSHSPRKLPRIFSMLSFSATALFSISKIRKFKPEYIFTESPPLALGLSGLALARATGARHILNVSDLWPLSAYRLGALSKGTFYNMVVKLEKYLYRKSYACTGQSSEIIEHIRLEGGKQVHLFRNGVDVKRFQNIQHAEVTNNSVPLKIIYTGLLGVAQGMAGICRHIDFAGLNAELHIYGEGSERAAIEEYIKEHPHKGIIYYGLAKREDIPAILSKADVALIPLIKPIEGAVPSKIYEAMAAGLPVIFSGGGEGEQIVKDYDTGWICQPRKYDEISACIQDIAQGDRTVLLPKRANCLAAAKNVFNREIQIDQLHQLLLKGK
jgi:glycosyltransferase involved in cell wall biosynthesis